MLEQAGHDVLTVNEAGLTGTRDALVLDYAIRENRVLLTRNCDDFEDLHEANPLHPGILAVYQNENYAKDLSRQEIVKAIANLEAARIPLTNQFMALNHWNY